MTASVSKMFQQELLQVESSATCDLGRILNGRRREEPYRLAFSGGGIRSATFIWACFKPWRKPSSCTYSTSFHVSGGGYIGGWLMAWMHHQQIGIHEIEERLSPHKYTRGRSRSLNCISAQLQQLFTPAKVCLGLTSGLCSQFMRNTILNQIILTLLLLSVLLFRRAGVPSQSPRSVETIWHKPSGQYPPDSGFILVGLA